MSAALIGPVANLSPSSRSTDGTLAVDKRIEEMRSWPASLSHGQRGHTRSLTVAAQRPKRNSLRHQPVFLILAAIVAATLAHAEPHRIVSTGPAITELLYALGLGDHVVGVTRFCHYPPEALSKPKIGDWINPNLEVIASLKPDLVIVQTNPNNLAARLAPLHVHTLEVNEDTIAAIYTSIRTIGAATGTMPRATQLIDSIRAQLDEIRKRASQLKPVPVMFVIGRTPNRLDGMVVAGKASYLDELIRLAGGDNVFRDSVAAYPAVSLEEVMARNPEVVIDMGDMSDTVNVSEEHRRSVVVLWQRASVLTAVKQHRVFAVAADIYVVPGPRVVDAARAFFEMLHPENQ
jgi:iron complex transport system substrate-binding protein